MRRLASFIRLRSRCLMIQRGRAGSMRQQSLVNGHLHPATYTPIHTHKSTRIHTHTFTHNTYTHAHTKHTRMHMNILPADTHLQYTETHIQTHRHKWIDACTHINTYTHIRTNTYMVHIPCTPILRHRQTHTCLAVPGNTVCCMA